MSKKKNKKGREFVKKFGDLLTPDQIKAYTNFGEPDTSQSYLELFTTELVDDLFTIMKSCSDNQLKSDYVEKELNPLGFNTLGLGTNILVMVHPRYPGVVFKIALDDNGIADNFNDCILQDIIPHYVKVFARHPSSIVTVQYRGVRPTEYQMTLFRPRILALLKELSKFFLIADLSPDMFLNYVVDRDGDFLICDGSDLYPLDQIKDKIRCNKIVGEHKKTGELKYCEGKLHYTEDFKYLICEKCGKQFNPLELRPKKEVEKVYKVMNDGLNADEIKALEQDEKIALGEQVGDVLVLEEGPTKVSLDSLISESEDDDSRTIFAAPEEEEIFEETDEDTGCKIPEEDDEDDDDDNVDFTSLVRRNLSDEPYVDIDAKVKELEEALASAKDTINKSEAEKYELQQQVTRLSDQAATAKASVEATEMRYIAEVEDALGKLNAANLALVGRDEAIKELQASMDKASKNLSTAEVELNVLRAENTLLTEKVQKAAADYAAISSVAAEAKMEVERLTAEASGKEETEGEISQEDSNNPVVLMRRLKSINLFAFSTAFDEICTIANTTPDAVKTEVSTDNGRSEEETPRSIDVVIQQIKDGSIVGEDLEELKELLTIDADNSDITPPDGPYIRYEVVNDSGSDDSDLLPGITLHVHGDFEEAYENSGLPIFVQSDEYNATYLVAPALELKNMVSKTLDNMKNDNEGFNRTE